MGSNITLNNLDEYLQFNDCMERVKFLTSIEIPPSLIGSRAYSDLNRLVSMAKAIHEEYSSISKPSTSSSMADQVASDLVKQMTKLDQPRGLGK